MTITKGAYKARYKARCKTTDYKGLLLSFLQEQRRFFDLQRWLQQQGLLVTTNLTMVIALCHDKASITNS